MQVLEMLCQKCKGGQTPHIVLSFLQKTEGQVKRIFAIRFATCS